MLPSVRDILKLAISGKGGVGKTFLSAMLAKTMAQAGYLVTAIDADPDANLALSLGFPDVSKITPISEMKDLIQERTGTQPGSSSPYFKINPRVDDIPEKYSVKHQGIRLLVMGRPKAGGAGCYCPENTVLAALMAHLLLAHNEMLVMDMAAGIEHLNRGTARAVDRLIIVVEPGRASIETAGRITALARDLGITSVSLVGNKVHNVAERDFISSSLTGYDILGFIPYDISVIQADFQNNPKLDVSPQVNLSIKEVFNKLILQSGPTRA
jgi:CO dehydrogenase maturation factor